MSITKNRILLLAALINIIGAIFSFSAYASGDLSENLIVNATSLDGDILNIEITNIQTGIASDMEVDLRNYSLDDEYISISAMDADGNVSNVVQVKNPYYSPTATTSVSDLNPTSDTRPFTPDGNATVTDNATDKDGKEFFTFTTPNENVFYLVVDRQRENENVYFLNAVTEDDLVSLAKKADDKGTSAIPTPEPTPQATVTPEPTPEPVVPPKSGGSGAMIFLLLAVLAAVGAGYYFKIYKPSQQAHDMDDDVDESDDYIDENDDDFDDKLLEDDNLPDEDDEMSIN